MSEKINRTTYMCPHCGCPFGAKPMHQDMVDAGLEPPCKPCHHKGLGFISQEQKLKNSLDGEGEEEYG